MWFLMASLSPGKQLMRRAVVAEKGRGPLRALWWGEVSLALLKGGEGDGHWGIKEDSWG